MRFVILKLYKRILATGRTIEGLSLPKSYFSPFETILYQNNACILCKPNKASLELKEEAEIDVDIFRSIE